ncbi:MAG: 3-oxoacyl-ACP reductase family protein [Candidatus Asgardarchaeia archaeon]
MELENKIAFVTGGNRGIGRAIVLELAKEGCSVIFTYVKNEKKAKDVANLLKTKEVSFDFFKMDVRDRDNVNNVVETIIRKYGRIDILVNNAGIMAEHHSITEIPYNEWQAIIDTNLTGVFNVTQAVVPYMIESRFGKIVNISSVAGKTGGTVGVHYAASKAGVIGFTLALARELLPYNITVNAIAPGPIETEMIKGLPEERKKKILAKVPMGRLGKPKEVAIGVIFLLKNDYITGEILDINGGYIMD